MIPPPWSHVERCRIAGDLGTCDGAFQFDVPTKLSPPGLWTPEERRKRLVSLRVIASTGVPGTEFDWEHVSVSHALRTPTWAEMCFIKSLFWHPEEAVMQLHPPQSTYVNVHPNVLHMWRPLSATVPLPPLIMV